MTRNSIMSGLLASAILSSGCIMTGPVSVAWRSNAKTQYADLEGRIAEQEDHGVVNADRTAEHALQVATATDQGTSTNAPQTQSMPPTVQTDSLPSRTVAPPTVPVASSPKQSPTVQTAPHPSRTVAPSTVPAASSPKQSVQTNK